MFNIWKFYIKPMITFTNIHSAKGRKLRVEKLLATTKESEDICKAIVYGRDIKYYPYFSEYEMADCDRIIELLKLNQLVLPNNRTFLKDDLVNHD